MSGPRLILALLGLAILASGGLASGHAATYTAAAYTTTSQMDVTASIATGSGWLHLYTESTDPVFLTGYATQRVQSGVGPVCATGVDGTLDLVMGGVPKSGGGVTFDRAFTLETPVTFPDASVTAVSIAATYLADPSSGKQPIRDCRFSEVGATGGRATVTLGPGAKRQANLRLRINGGGWDLGSTYHPTLRLTVTWATGSSVQDIPLSVTHTDW